MIIGSARIDENGKISGGNAGDQTGKEVSTQEYYVHSKGWYLVRPKEISVANKTAEAMLQACDNPNIGYDQNQRESIVTQFLKYKKLSNIKTPCEVDCSKLVQLCVYQAIGKDPGNFTTLNAVEVLVKTGIFEQKVNVTSNTVLYNGDILCTKTKGHIVVVVSGNPRKQKTNSLDMIAKEVISGKWGQGEARKLALTKAGFNYKEVQQLVNEMLK